MIMLCNRDLETTMEYLAPLLQGSEGTISYNIVVTRQHGSSLQLQVEDYLGGLMRAKRKGLVDFGPDGFDAEEYNHLGSPLNGNLHEVVPGKLVLMQGPRDLCGGALWQDTHRADGGFAHRDFSAARS
jgi:hypothetical protein